MNKELGSVTQDGQTEFTQAITGVFLGIFGLGADKSPASLPSRVSQPSRMSQDMWPTQTSNISTPDFSPVSVPTQRPAEMSRASTNISAMPENIEELLEEIA